VLSRKDRLRYEQIKAREARRRARADCIPPDAAEICRACLRPGCPNVHRCCGGRVDLHIQVPCPEGRWGSAATPTSPAAGIHYQVDTIGSRAIATK